MRFVDASMAIAESSPGGGRMASPLLERHHSTSALCRFMQVFKGCNGSKDSPPERQLSAISGRSQTTANGQKQSLTSFNAKLSGALQLHAYTYPGGIHQKPRNPTELSLSMAALLSVILLLPRCHRSSHPL